MSNPINIVVIGGNYSGTAISQHIFKHITPFSTNRPVKVTIISPSTKFYWTIGTPRGILNKPELLKPETLQEDIVTSFTKVYGPQGETWEFLEAWVRNVDVNSKTVTIEPVVDNIKTKSSVPYDHLIIASGTRNHNPFQTPKSTSREDQLDIVAPFKPHGTTEETITALKSWGKKIADANTILLVGAGPTGVETAGEIQFAYPNKKVILVTSDNILPMLQPRISLSAKTMLEKLGIDVRTHTRVSSVNPAPYGNSLDVVLSTGETIPVDLFIPTLGQVPNTEFLPKDLLDNRGYVKTTKYFSNPNKPDIWAIGDVTEFDGDRQSATIPAQVGVLTYNLKRAVLEEGAIVGQGAGWSEYAPSTDVMMFVPVGRKQGVGQLKTWRVWSFFVWLIKGRDFMVSWMSASINGGTVAKKLKRVELKN